MGGVILMAIAMLVLPVVDGIAKYLSHDHSPLFLSWARCVAAGLIVLPVSLAVHGARPLPTARLGSHLLRTVFLVLAMSLYYLAVARIPLATATSAYLSAPVMAVVLAVVILGERLTRAKLAGLALGFAGAMAIVRPGGAVEPAILLAFAAGLTFAFYLVATRRMAEAEDPLKTLAFQCVAGAVLLTPQAVANWSVPARAEIVLFAGLGLVSALCHFLSIAAFRRAEASVLAPLVYVELVGAALIGYFAFGEVPGLATLAGAALIAAAGLALARRERQPAAGPSETA